MKEMLRVPHPPLPIPGLKMHESRGIRGVARARGRDSAVAPRNPSAEITF